MQLWVVRALGMTLLHATAQITVALVRATRPGAAPVAEAVALAVLVAAAVLWAAVDGWRCVEDGARTWFVAALVAGPAAGLLGLIGRAVFVDATGTEALGTALVGGAAFTALLVLVPAMVGLVGGRRLEEPAHRGSTGG